MGLNVIKIPEHKLPFTYPKNYVYKVRDDIDNFIYFHDTKFYSAADKGGFQPARLIAILLGMLHNNDTENVEKYTKLLLDNSEITDNRLLFLYKFHFLLHASPKEVMRPDWVSGFAQGMGLVLFCKFFEKNKFLPPLDYLMMINKIRNGFTDDRIMQRCENGDLFFHEYQGGCDALNGHIYALYGLYYHWYLTDNSLTLNMLKAGINFVLNNINRYRNEGNASFYCTRHKVVTDKAGGKYHSVHINQLLFLYQITQDERFKKHADEFLSDFTPTRKTGTEINLSFP